jgi:hypothetical protein
MGLAMLTLMIAQGLAQAGALAGSVFDEDELPIRSATITVVSDNLVGGPRSVETDRDGQYRIEDLPPGEHTLSAEQKSFQDLTSSPPVLHTGSDGDSGWLEQTNLL